MFLHLIGTCVLLPPFSKVLTDFVVLLEQSQALGIWMIRATFYDDGGFLNLWVVNLLLMSRLHCSSNSNKSRMPLRIYKLY